MVTQKSRDLSIKNGDFTKKQWEYHGILVGYIYICVYIYMIIDLKVLVTSFNCKDRSCYAGNPSRKFFFASSQKKTFKRESFAKVGYCESLSLYTLQLVKGYHLLPTGRPAGEWYHISTFPFIGSSQASEGQASPQPNAMVLKHMIAPAAGTV